MLVRYRDAAIERLCTQEREAQKVLGRPCARRLKARMADLFAAHNPTELVAGHPHALKGDRKGQYAVNLQGGVRLCLEPDRKPPPALPDGGIDWARVTEIVIVFIGDYHD